MPLNIQAAGQPPTTENYPARNVSGTKLKQSRIMPWEPWKKSFRMRHFIGASLHNLGLGVMPFPILKTQPGITMCPISAL